MRLIDADAMKADFLTVDPQYGRMIYWCSTILDAQPTIKPEWAKIDSGAIELELPVDVSQVKRVIVKQKDSHWCGVYYLGGHEE